MDYQRPLEKRNQEYYIHIAVQRLRPSGRGVVNCKDKTTALKIVEALDFLDLRRRTFRRGSRWNDQEIPWGGRIRDGRSLKPWSRQNAPELTRQVAWDLCQ